MKLVSAQHATEGVWWYLTRPQS